MSLDSMYIHTDVTAVSLYDGFIIAGIGSSMYVYSTKSTKPLHRLICLRGQKIYGFKRSGCSIIVFGGKQMTLIVGPHSDCIQGYPVFTRQFEPVLCDDWLHSVAWTAGGTEVSVLTAHNVVQKYNPTTLSLISRHSSKDNSILYSGLLLALKHDVLVMAGTVYSEVIIHVCGEDEPLHRLSGHKGVIFSISCLPEKNIIVTTSDDRSVRIWGQNCAPQEPWNTIDYWKREIVCKHELYGHFARVMRSSITSTHIVSVGEDSRVCYWSHDGVLDRKVKRHQNAGIWSIDTQNQLLITGGGDGAVTVQSYSPENNYHNSEVLHLDIGKPKHISYSCFQNLYILTESNRFIYYDTKEKVESDSTIGLEFNATFHAFSVSPNRVMSAIAGRKSIIQIATEVQKTIDDKVTVEFNTVKLEGETILSVHWASNYHLVACSEKGVITVLTVTLRTVDPCTVFELPNCKERWLTCAANSHEMFVFGDRCGGIHIYKEGLKHPLKSFSKIHGRYGPTSISISKDNMITTGRDRTIKYFKIDGEFKLGSTKELDFHWIERFLDPDHKIVCGFREKMFIVFSLRTNETLMEISCGGGHRSWDVLYKTDENNQLVLNLMYLKNSNIKTESVGMSMPVSVTLGSHSKEINSLKSLQFDGKTVFVSGGEDTTLRVSTLDSNMVFDDIDICKNLSSVRTIKICKEQDEILVISAGGRAQICIRLLKLIKTNNKVEVKTTDLIDYMLKGTDKERKGDNNWRNVSKDSEPETRIMDLDYVKNKEKYTIFAGCSDARVRVFVFDTDKMSLDMIKESEYLPTCILKTVCIKLLNHDVLITCSTRGDVSFWYASIDEDFKPFFATTTNKSGINSIATNIIDNQILIATGGDDNSLHINIFTVLDRYNLSSMQVQHSLVLDKHHSSAITGICLIRDYILTTSIDQRITLYKWKVTDKISCDFLYQTYSDVADIKGMDVIAQKSTSLSVCVYGEGIEVFDMTTDHT